MLSYSAQLQKIGYSQGSRVSYLEFASRPSSLRQAMQSMDAPNPAGWKQVSDISRDEVWTDEVQGVAFDGANWIFSCNANQMKPGHNDKAIYVFPGSSHLKDGQWSLMIPYKNIPNPTSSTESQNHFGQLTYYNGYIYISHFYPEGSLAGHKYVLVLKDEGGQLQFSRWIELEEVTFWDDKKNYPEFQAINPWDGCLYTCRGGPKPMEFFIHDLNTGKFIRKFSFNGGLLNAFPAPIYLPTNVQGACFSPNGHLYIACDVRYPENPGYKMIAYFSALNGQFMGTIPVLAKESNQELEGLCYADVYWDDGRNAQLHVVLLENPADGANKDNIFFKSFVSDQPELV